MRPLKARLQSILDQFNGATSRALACALTDRCAGLILGFEIEFDLDVSDEVLGFRSESHPPPSALETGRYHEATE